MNRIMTSGLNCLQALWDRVPLRLCRFDPNFIHILLLFNFGVNHQFSHGRLASNRAIESLYTRVIQ